jgi:hypothetical protein
MYKIKLVAIRRTCACPPLFVSRQISRLSCQQEARYFASTNKLQKERRTRRWGPVHCLANVVTHESPEALVAPVALAEIVLALIATK